MSLFHKPAALAAVSSIAVLTAAAARAQQFEPPAATPVSEIVVAATLTPTPRTQVGSSITLITGQEIEDRQWRTLPDALAQTPGLNLIQAGGPGGLTSVFIRGTNANHTEVIIDGMDVNDPSQNGAFDFGQALATGVARI
ncbi:MAG TPA: TonB-dependent receptor plug domain-containing protein, partial [Caulobacteraceae bacterium]